jgi:hypothetical protein
MTDPSGFLVNSKTYKYDNIRVNMARMIDDTSSNSMAGLTSNAETWIEFQSSFEHFHRIMPVVKQALQCLVVN